MPAFIAPPPNIPFYLRLGIWLARRVTGKDLLPPRLLAWYPKAAISSGAMEALVAHGDDGLDARLLKIVRLQVSCTAACPFCIDMNGFDPEHQLTAEEANALQAGRDPDTIATFSLRERLAAQYARGLSLTPPAFSPELIAAVRAHLTERELVILATTAAQVNYWARLLQGLGVPPAGFTDACAIPPSITPP